MALYGPRADEFMQSSTYTYSDTTFAGGGGWLNYLNLSCTTTVRGPIIASASIALAYEQGAVNCTTRFIAGSSAGNNASGTSMEYPLGIQRDSNRMDSGTGSMLWLFEDLAAGTYVITWQVKNHTNNSTIKLGGPHNPGTAAQLDTLHCMYCA